MKKTMTPYHKPVLGEKVLHYLDIGNKRMLVDATLGDGGHTELILENTGPDCRVLGIDRDADALARARERLARFGDRVILAHGKFSEIKAILNKENIMHIDGLLMDLGVSSPQLDRPERGFSFRQDGPLDMRMDRSEKTTAADLLERLSDSELEHLIKVYGEERKYKKVVRAIRKAQATSPITTTLQLSAIVSSAVRAPRTTKIHPATRTFQALRIAINQELEHLQMALRDSLDILNQAARLVVISFHSLEDRIVKQFFKTEEKGCQCPPRFPVCVCGIKPTLSILTSKPVTPSKKETAANPRSSSSKLRAAERIYV